ncbi:MAG: Sucraseferredoxin family protein [Acidimicrobiales bacterium]|nr:Sucraseferredoxin family protein [Acidimicrobiales bacterium]
MVGTRHDQAATSVPAAAAAAMTDDLAVTVDDAGVRCAAWARGEGVLPIGTAGTYDGYLLVDLALPWSRDVSEAIELTAVVRRAAELRIRIQATVPRQPATRRVTLYRRPPGEPFLAMEWTHRTVAPASLAADALSLLDHGETRAGGSHVLVCTHGRRDTCCGSLGTRLVSDLESSFADPIRVSRTSHTGGHRFAPTFIVLPEATCWAYADLDLVDRVVNRRGPIEDVVDRYRGCAGLAHPAHQAIEREVLRRVGWPLLERPRHGLDLDGGRTGFVAQRADGGLDRWDAEVFVRRRLPVPDCGNPITAGLKTEAELGVRDLVHR